MSVLQAVHGRSGFHDLPDDVVAASLPCKAEHPPFKVCLQVSHRCKALLRHESLDLWAALQKEHLDLSICLPSTVAALP